MRCRLDLRLLARIASFASASFFTLSAAAGNDEMFYLGSDAALLGGAVTATTSGPSALWYNPARLANHSLESVDVSLAAYMVRVGGTQELRSPDGRISTQSYGGASIQAVPTAAAYSRKIAGWDIGFGLFVPNIQVTDPRASATLANTSGQALLDISRDRTDYYAGVGFGRHLAPNLALGLSVLGFLRAASATESIAMRGPTGSFSTQATSFDEQNYGMRIALGLAYRATETLSLGLTLRTPVFELVASRTGSIVSSAGSASAANATLEIDQGAGARGTKFLAPAQLISGIAWEPSKNAALAFDVRVRAPRSPSADETEGAVIDVRAGGRARTGSSTWFGGGLFTNRSGVTRSGTTSLDYYGATLALELGTPYHTTDPAGMRGKLHVATSFAFSYALGLGTLGNINVAAEGDRLVFTPRDDRAVAHEFTLTLGTSLADLLSAF